MSASFQAKTTAVLNQQLKIQEVVIRAADKNLYVIDTSNVVVIISEPLASVTACYFHDNSAATLTSQVAADMTLVDSAAYTAGGDKSAIRLASVPALDANDHIVVRYVVQE